MIPSVRRNYNQQFSSEKYQAYLRALENVYPGQLDFRVAETPVFVSAEFTQKMLSACDHIIDIIRQPGYLVKTEKAIPADLRVPNEDGNPHFIAFEFGVC